MIQLLYWICKYVIGFIVVVVLLLFVLLFYVNELCWLLLIDLQMMDLYVVNLVLVLGFLNNVYEGFVRCDWNMVIEGLLVESWELIGIEGWCFNLCEGVKFYDGVDFIVEDVLFFYEWVFLEEVDISFWFFLVKEVKIVDDYMIDFLIYVLNLIFLDLIVNFMIFDKGWVEVNNVVCLVKDVEIFVMFNINGIGLFKLISWEFGVEIVLELFDGWWDIVEYNIIKVIFLLIVNFVIVVFGLLFGQVDLINFVFVQDVNCVVGQDGLKLY